MIHRQNTTATQHPLTTPQAGRESPRRGTRSQRSAHIETKGASRPTQETRPAAANGEKAIPTASESIGRQQWNTRQERQTAKHWDAITRQWQHGKLKKRARTEATTGANRHKQSVTSQPKITRFLTTTRRAVDRKRGGKRKRDAEPRAQQAHRPTQVQDDTADKETDTDTEEHPVTQDAKRQKIDRTGIG